MELEDELRLRIKCFEFKKEQLEKAYKEKHPDDFDKKKMERHINSKMRADIHGMIACNINPTAKIISSDKNN